MTKISNPQIGIILQDAKVQKTRRPEISLSMWQWVGMTILDTNRPIFLLYNLKNVLLLLTINRSGAQK
jgi:hypothetical protein